MLHQLTMYFVQGSMYFDCGALLPSPFPPFGELFPPERNLSGQIGPALVQDSRSVD